MKSGLKRYNQFIKESKVEDKIVKNLLERYFFWKLLMELNYYEFDMRRSFSEMCKTKNDPDRDFQKIQNYFDSKGFTIDKIKELFSKENNSAVGYDLQEFYVGSFINSDFSVFNNIIGNLKSDSHLLGVAIQIEEPFLSVSKLNSESAAVDIYLYKLFEKLGLDENIVSLGGDGWCNWRNVDGKGEEAFIRYQYGYHNTKYGQLMLKQVSATEEDLREDALKYLQEFIEYNFDLIISNTYENKYGVRVSNLINIRLSDIKIDQFVIVEDDRYIVDIIDISNYFNSLNTRKGDKLVDNYKIEPADIASEFVKIFDGLNLDIVFTGNDLIIYSKFKE